LANAVHLAALLQLAEEVEKKADFGWRSFSAAIRVLFLLAALAAEVSDSAL